MKLTKALFALIVSSAALFSEEAREWREMRFFAPSINYVFEIKTAPLDSNSDGIRRFYWGGKIAPRFWASNEFRQAFNGFSGECSVETFEYAYSITNPDRASDIADNEWASLNFGKRKSEGKCMFVVANTPSNPGQDAYRGFITKEEFATLMGMLQKDISAHAPKARTLSNTAASAKSTELQSLLSKKMEELSHAK